MTYQYNPFTQALETKADNAIARWNASKISGKLVPTGNPGFKQLLSYNVAAGSYEYSSSYTSINVLNFIPATEHQAIAERYSNLDVSSFIQAAIDATAIKGGTVTFPDGTYRIGTPIILKRKVSLKGLAKSSTIKALATFDYTNVAFPKKALIKTDLDDTGFWEDNQICTLILDGNNVADYGLELIRVRYDSIIDLDIIGCVIGGLAGASSTAFGSSFELKFDNIWIYRGNFLNAPSSVGFHLDNITDCYSNRVIVIGYYTGFRDTGGTNNFIQCHAWNRPPNGSLKYGFWCGGTNGHFIGCYADTPVDGINEAYGFYVDKANIRITDSFVYNFPDNGADNTAIGIFCSANASSGSNCVFSNNAIYASSNLKRIKQDIGGDYTFAVTFNNISNNVVTTSFNKLQKRLQVTGGLSVTFNATTASDPGNGNVNIEGLLTTLNTTVTGVLTGAGQAVFNAPNISTRPLTVKGAVNHTNDVFQIQRNDFAVATGFSYTPTSSAIKLRGVNTSLEINQSDATNDSLSNFNPVTGSATAQAQFRFFRGTNTTGAVGIVVYKGDNTTATNTYIAANGNSFLNSVVGNVGIGMSTGITAKLHVAGDIIATTTVTGSNLSGTNTGDQTIATIPTLQTTLDSKVDLTTVQSITGQKTFNASSTAVRAIVAKGAATQTTDIIQVNRSDDSLVMGVSSSVGSGNIRLKAANTFININQTDGGVGQDSLTAFDPIPGTTTNQAQFRFFRGTNTTASVAINIFRGDSTATVNTTLGANGNSFFNASVGNIAIGHESPNSKLHLVGGAIVAAATGFQTDPGAGNLTVVGRTSTTALSLSPVTLTATATLSINQTGYLVDATAGNIVLTLPSAATGVGHRYTFKRIDGTANTVTINAATGQTVEFAASTTLDSSPVREAIDLWAGNSTSWYIV